MTVKQYQGYLICGLMALQGALMIVGDVGCYLTWHCTELLGWHGELGAGLMLAATVASTIHIWQRRRS